MNLSDSIKFVLRNKSQTIFTLLVKEDLKNTVKDVPRNVVAFTKLSKKAIRSFRFKESMGDVKESIQGTAILLKVIPQRVNQAFKHFGQDFTKEIDQLTDSKERTVFCMKVIAGLCKFALSSAYDVGLGDVKLLGLKKGKILYSRVIVAKLMYKTIQAFIVRFIDEIEKQITEPEELKQLDMMKKMILDDKGNAIDKIFEGVTDPNDKAFILVENFRKYILTGERDQL